MRNRERPFIHGNFARSLAQENRRASVDEPGEETRKVRRQHRSGARVASVPRPAEVTGDEIAARRARHARTFVDVFVRNTWNNELAKKRESRHNLICSIGAIRVALLPVNSEQPFFFAAFPYRTRAIFEGPSDEFMIFFFFYEHNIYIYIYSSRQRNYDAEKLFTGRKILVESYKRFMRNHIVINCLYKGGNTSDRYRVTTLWVRPTVLLLRVSIDSRRDDARFADW